MRRNAAYLLALLLDLAGAGGALLVSARTWQVIRTPQPRPLPDDVLDLSGRTVDAAITAFALVALAGVVAVLATRGLVRRVVGGVIVLAGAGLIWRAVLSAPAVGAGRARALVRDHHRAVSLGSAVRPLVVTHDVWPVLTGVCGAVVLVAGALVAARGHRWTALSARYENRATNVETEADAGAAKARTVATMWNALDDGRDPTTAPREDEGPA